MRSSSLSDRALGMISSSGPEFSRHRSPRVYVPGQAVTVRRGLVERTRARRGTERMLWFEAVVSSVPMVARRLFGVSYDSEITGPATGAPRDAARSLAISGRNSKAPG